MLAASGCSDLGRTIISNVAGPQLKGSGVLGSEHRQVKAFHAIKTDGAIQSKITIGEDRSIEISGDDNIVPIVTTEVRDGVLRIRIDHQGSLSTKQGITATIVTPTLDDIDLDGACNAEVTGIQSPTLEVELDGASRLTVSGSCESLDAELDGASKLKATKLTCEDAKIETDGASSAHVNVAGSLSADADGASSIRYLGNPSIQQKKSGAASVKALTE